MSPKTGARTAREMAWLKTVPKAMAEGLTGGRSVGSDLSVMSQAKAEMTYYAPGGKLS